MSVSRENEWSKGGCQEPSTLTFVIALAPLPGRETAAGCPLPKALVLGESWFVFYCMYFLLLVFTETINLFIKQLKPFLSAK